MSLGRRIVFALLGALALFIAITAWMSRHSFRREPVPVEVGLHGEALENDTLFLQKWIAASGRPVERKGGFFDARDLPEGGTLILLRVAQPLNEKEVEELLAWVRRGGLLITDGSAAPFNDERGLAALHKALGVTLKDLGDKASGHGERTASFHEGETPYRLRLSRRWRLEPADPKAWFRIGSKQGESLLNRGEGLGALALTPDLSYLYHEGIADLDTAAYVERLLQLNKHPGAAVVVWSKPIQLSLFAWLWEHAWPAILALLALVGAWLWRGWPRFGPTLPEPLPQRRSLLEHLSASARLMWQGGAAEHLVARTREGLERRAQRLNPAFGALDLGARADWLAESTGFPANAIAAALDDRPGRNPHQLAHALVILEQLRQRL